MVLPWYCDGIAVWHKMKRVQLEKKAMLLWWYCTLACGEESGARQESNGIAMVLQYHLNTIAIPYCDGIVLCHVDDRVELYKRAMVLQYHLNTITIPSQHCSLACGEESGARQESDGAAAERRKLTHYTDAPEKGGGGGHSCFVKKYKMRAYQWENDSNTFL